MRVGSLKQTYLAVLNRTLNPLTVRLANGSAEVGVAQVQSVLE